MTLLAVPLRATAAYQPLDPRQVYHLYVVDLASVSEQEGAVVGYVVHRWSALIDPDTAQNGRIVFIDGLEGRVSTLDLSIEDRNQPENIARRLHLEVKTAQSKRRGVDLGTAADVLKEVVETRFSSIAAPESARDLTARRLLFMHVLTDQLVRSQRNRPRSLESYVFPETCMEDGAATSAAAAFQRQVSTNFSASAEAQPQLKFALALVPGDRRRFGEAAERSASQVLLGRSVLEGRATARRDGLSCLEVDDHIAPPAVTPGDCQPRHAPQTRPAQTRETCLPLDSVDKTEAVAELARKRIDQEIAPFLDGRYAARPGEPPGGSAPASVDLDRARGGRDPAKPPEGEPGPRSAADPTAPVATEVRRDPVKAPGEGTRPVATSTDPGKTLPPGERTEPGPPSEPSPPPSKPRSGGTGADTTPVVPPEPVPSPPVPTAPPPVESRVRPPPQAMGSEPVPSASDPAKTHPRPGATFTPPSAPPAVPRARLSAASAFREIRNATSGYFPLGGKVSVSDGSTTVYLVPLGRTLAEADPGRIVDATGDVRVRPGAGVYSLVARLSPRIVCEADGRFAFSYSLIGTALAAQERGEFLVEVPDACRNGGGDVLFGKVTVK